MALYHLPPQALKERACFCVQSECGKELLVIPFGCVDIPSRFGGFIYLPWSDDAILSAPITPLTLVPESLAESFAQNPVIISSQLCGGTLKHRLEESLEHYPQRIFFAIEPLRHTLPLPCPNADAQLITEEESQNLRQKCKSYFTDAFCCHYCVDESAKLVHLFDTDETIEMKIKLAESFGVSNILCLPT